MNNEGRWAMDEFGGAQVGDARLTKRLIKLADRLAEAPSASIPEACNGHAETQPALNTVRKTAASWGILPAFQT